MALADDAVRISVTMVDQGGNQGTKNYDTTLTVGVDGLPAIEAARDALVAALNGASTALVSKADIVLGQSEDTAVVGTGELENLALITANLATAGKTVNLFVPAPEDGIFQGASGPTYNLVDGADAAVVALLDLFETGADFTISDGEQLDATTPFRFGKRIHRRSTRG